eukprot:3958715-Pyramimonas_sp.AAC.1
MGKNQMFNITSRSGLFARSSCEDRGPVLDLGAKHLQRVSHGTPIVKDDAVQVKGLALRRPDRHLARGGL